MQAASLRMRPFRNQWLPWLLSALPGNGRDQHWAPIWRDSQKEMGSSQSSVDHMVPLLPSWWGQIFIFTQTSFLDMDMPPLSVTFLPVPPSINLRHTHSIDSDEGAHFTAQKQLACWKGEMAYLVTAPIGFCLYAIHPRPISDLCISIARINKSRFQ